MTRVVTATPAPTATLEPTLTPTPVPPPTVTTGPSPTPIMSKGNWQTPSVSDPFEEDWLAYVTLEASEYNNSSLLSTPQLFVACRQHNLELVLDVEIKWGTHSPLFADPSGGILGILGGRTVSVGWRIDDESALSSHWWTTADRISADVLLADSSLPDRIVNGLLRGDKLTVRLEGAANVKLLRAVWHPVGIFEAIRPIAATCGMYVSDISSDPTLVRSAWLKTSLVQDRLTDEKSVAFYADATYHHRPSEAADQDIPALYIRCREAKGPEVFIHWGGSHMSTGFSKDQFQSSVRFNDKEPEQTTWSESTTNEATFSQQPEWFIESAKTADTIFVRVWDVADKAHDAEFNVRGLAEMMATEPEVCGS